MGILDFLTGEFIDVIHWTDETRDTMVWRFERYDHAIKYGAKLTVREGQAAVFVHEGQIADVFRPGLYELETNNLPILTTLQHWDHGFSSPFKSEIYFVNTTRFTDQKWGTKNPIIVRDPEFGPTRIRAFGTYVMKVADPSLFLKEIVGTDGEFTADEISFQIRNIIVQDFSRMIAGSGIPLLDMAANTEMLGKLVAKGITPAVSTYGLEIPEFYIENISLPEAVEAVLDKRTSMGIVGDLNRFTQYAAADALGQPGGAAGGAMGAAIGAGMGAGMGMNMGAQIGPWGAAPAQAAPPPLPPAAEIVWHLAEGGQATGPYGRAHLARLVSEGRFSRESLVWTPGQDGWKPAGDIPDLARLFTVQPPPLPSTPSVLPEPEK
ncbi:SPFH domain-containing protein [Frigidibacter sp. SD6-1]|uniref:SPFH domain-containing protein n=1 Tax=Frigidibacter sp. SD6-1 TaxID=3032581 RepID=UPI0024DFCD10|nr:SPFH domain-containing protein [Frigidibacter sp. SD6-1]